MERQYHRNTGFILKASSEYIKSFLLNISIILSKYKQLNFDAIFHACYIAYSNNILPKLLCFYGYLLFIIYSSIVNNTL